MNLAHNISGFDISSRFFEISNNGKIIVSHGYKGVYKLSVNSDFTNIIDYELDSIALKGGNTSLAKFDNNIYYNYDKGMLKYNSLSNDFSIIRNFKKTRGYVKTCDVIFNNPLFIHFR